MKFLSLLFLGAVAGLDHIVSFNMKCDATANLFAGTQVQAALAADRVPFQFVHALERVIQARVASVPNCQSFATVESTYPGTQPYSQLFGMQIINVLRWLDSADTTIDNAQFPAGCNQNAFGWNWKWLRKQFPGIKMPSTCAASTFYSKDCHLTFEFVPGFNVTLWLKDSCNDPLKAGFHLPQIELRCTGALCNSFGTPCTSNSDCGTVTCDPVDLWLNNGTNVLQDVGFFNGTYDSASCAPDAQGYTFAEQFFSKVVNNLANLIGARPTVDTKKWHQLSICGASAFQTKYIPTTAPTPVPFFVCENGTHLPTSVACNGVLDCQTGEDESNCGCGFSGGLIQSQCSSRCCSVCDTDSSNCCGPWFEGGQYCSLVGGGGNNGPTICTADQVTGVYDCSAHIGATTGATGTITYPTLQAVQNPNTNQNIIGWADCSGNAQIGNPAAIGVVNFLHPYHALAQRLESIVSSMEGCRVGADTSNAYLRSQFYVWGIGFLGGLIFNNQASTPSYSGYTPGALADNSFRFYKSAEQKNCTSFCDPQPCNPCNCYNDCNYLQNPPFANLVAPGWSTCNGGTISGSHSCQLNAAIADWFKGSGFPSSWSTAGATFLELSISSDCPNDVFPQAFAVCDGSCGDKTKPDSGCCIMSKPLITIPAGGTCPQGYTNQQINSSITDWIFNTSVYNSTTQDTTLINFLQLLADHAYDFGTNPAFVPPTTTGPQSICIINGSTFSNNTDLWGNQTYTEDCPAPMTTRNGNQGCPQILQTGWIQACGVAGQPKCLSVPSGNPCPATGCPAGPTPAGCTLGVLCSGGAWVAPAAFLTLALQLVL
jgi:hypothetical protein